MLYQAAVILTYPVMLETALTPCALWGPALALQVLGLMGGGGGEGVLWGVTQARRWHC